jgi:hypothetical protein
MKLSLQEKQKTRTIEGVMNQYQWSKRGLIGEKNPSAENSRFIKR